MAIANGLGNSFKESISSMGSDVFYVSRFPWIITGSFDAYRNRPNVTFREAEKLDSRLVSDHVVNPSTGTNVKVKFRSRTLDSIPVIGTTEKQADMSLALPEYGRFLTQSDIQYKKFVCVIGSEIRDHIFKDGDPFNQ